MDYSVPERSQENPFLIFIELHFLSFFLLPTFSQEGAHRLWTLNSFGFVFCVKQWSAMTHDNEGDETRALWWSHHLNLLSSSSDNWTSCFPYSLDPAVYLVSSYSIRSPSVCRSSSNYTFHRFPAVTDRTAVIGTIEKNKGCHFLCGRVKKCP